MRSPTLSKLFERFRENDFPAAETKEGDSEKWEALWNFSSESQNNVMSEITMFKIELFI